MTATAADSDSEAAASEAAHHILRYEPASDLHLDDPVHAFHDANEDDMLAGRRCSIVMPAGLNSG